MEGQVASASGASARQFLMQSDPMVMMLPFPPKLALLLLETQPRAPSLGQDGGQMPASI